MPYKTIKEVTSLTGTTEKALRYYDEKLLLKPTLKKSEGRREWLYDDAAISRLQLIMLYRQVGFSVDEIGQLLDSSESRSSIISRQISQLTAQRSELDTRISIATAILLAEEMDLAQEGLVALRQCVDKLREEGILGGTE
ncbi:MAG: MerR family transcriptional regulator [Eubacterium sp.]|nr:MerR family transcriptional regulator [Candidatus Colimonas fimequi]